jgi:hypothetical protein
LKRGDHFEDLGKKLVMFTVLLEIGILQERGQV